MGKDKYNYYYLKQAAKDKSRIGTWKDIGVYSCSKYKYNPAKSQFYVLYDDGNKLVREGYCYGFVGPSGMVNEEEPTWYNVPLKSGDAIAHVVPASGYSAEVITDEFFSNLDKEINKLLADVGSIDLLEGFKMDLSV